MIVEITLPDERKAHVIGAEVVAFSDDVVPDAKTTTPAVEVILRGGVTLTAKYDTLKTFSARLQAARGGSVFVVHALPVGDRAAAVANNYKPKKPD
mgnify:CR=1 FL=1